MSARPSVGLSRRAGGVALRPPPCVALQRPLASGMTVTLRGRIWFLRRRRRTIYNIVAQYTYCSHLQSSSFRSAFVSETAHSFVGLDGNCPVVCVRNKQSFNSAVPTSEVAVKTNVHREHTFNERQKLTGCQLAKQSNAVVTTTIRRQFDCLPKVIKVTVT